MKLLIVCAAALILAGCPAPYRGDALDVAAYCDVAKPILWSKDDTRKTKEQADRENAKYKKLCQTQ